MRSKLTRILIRGFQRHHSYILRLSPTITTIVGATDSGKSALLRALQWGALNHLRGVSFVRKGSATASVAIWQSGGPFVRRRRTRKGSGTYKVGKLLLKAFGSKTPPEVQAALQLSDINFQSQMDAPFWFALSPGELSKRLNEVVDLELIDATLERLGRTVRVAKEKEAIAEAQHASACDRLRSVLHARDFDTDLKVVEELAAQWETLSGRILRARALLNEHRECAVRGRAYTTFLAEGTRLLELGQTAEKAHNRAAKMRTLWDIAQAALKRSTPPPPMHAIERLAARVAHAQKQGEALRLLQSECARQRSLRSLHARRAKRLANLLQKQIGKECPLCGSTRRSRRF